MMPSNQLVTIESPSRALESLSKEQLIALVNSIAQGRTAPTLDTISQQIEELHEAVTAPSTRVTVGEVIDLYLANVADRAAAMDFAHEHRRNLVNRLTMFKAEFAETLVSDARQYDLTLFIKAHPTWKSAWTIQYVSSAICCCFNWAVDQGIVEKNPYRRVKNTGYRKDRRPCTAPEYCQLMRHGTRALRRLLFFLRRTGCRTCEARCLKWSECELDGPAPCCTIVAHKTKTKTGRNRVIGLDAGTARFLRSLRRQRSPRMQHVFLNTEGRPWTRRALTQAVGRLVKRIGLDSAIGHRVTAYALRHMFAVACIKAGMELRAIADQMGHKSIQMLEEIYGITTRSDAERLGKVANEATRARLRERPKPAKKVD